MRIEVLKASVTGGCSCYHRHMDYGSFVIEVVADDGGFRGRVTRRDGRHFTIEGSLPHALFRHADTIVHATEAEAIADAKIIGDAIRPQ